MSQATSDHAPLTVVLVHGAFADSSSWNGVIERLQAAGIQVTAAPNPLRGISMTPPTSPASSSRSPGRSLWSATPMAAR
jgi:alpha-beta hydrolase superfamily lysophospholipase